MLMKPVRALLVLAVLCTLSSTTSAQPAADFYKGKTLALVVGFSPGGGSEPAGDYLRLRPWKRGANLLGHAC